MCRRYSTSINLSRPNFFVNMYYKLPFPFLKMYGIESFPALLLYSGNLFK